MRKAAIFAGVTWLLYGLFVAMPRTFGVETFSGDGQFGFRVLASASCFVLVLFFLGILIARSTNLGGAVKVTSIVLALALALENWRYVYNTTRYAVVAGSNSELWRFHKLKEVADLFVATIQALAIVTTILFLLLLFVRSLKARNTKPGPEDRIAFLRLISLLAATVSVIWLALAVLSIILAPRSLELSVAPILLRFATLIGLAVFFLTFGLNQTTKADYRQSATTSQ